MFTFKKHIATGRYRSFESESHDIKLRGHVVGTINELSENAYTNYGDLAGKYRVSFMVVRDKTEKDPAPFKWQRLKKHFDDAESARAFITKNSAQLLQLFDLYQQPK